MTLTQIDNMIILKITRKIELTWDQEYGIVFYPSEFAPSVSRFPMLYLSPYKLQNNRKISESLGVQLGPKTALLTFNLGCVT